MSGKQSYWEIDVIRGLAVILMLVNHGAVKVADKNLSLSELSLDLYSAYFFGMFAPVFFFFVTGFGYGVAHSPGRMPAYKDTVVKALLLLLADVFFRGMASQGFPEPGLDFLGFIGLSMLLLLGLRGRKHALILALGATFLLLLIRFVIPDVLKWAGFDVSTVQGLSYFLGESAMTGVSYWLTPWFTYPLLGFAFGIIFKVRLEIPFFKRWLIPCLWSLAFGSLLLSFLFSSLGFTIFRWGIVTHNFYIASIAFVSLVLCVVMSFCGDGGVVSRWLSIRGVASLAVVPIHYFTLYLYEIFYGKPVASEWFLLSLILWVGFCILLSEIYQGQLVKLVGFSKSGLSIFVLASLAFLFLVRMSGVSYLTGIVVCTLAQLLICILLVPAKKQ